MRSGQHLKLPKSEQQAFEADLRRQARMERLKIDIQVKDNGDGTVDIAWTVSEGTVPATSTTPTGDTGEGEGVTAAAPTAGPAPTAPTSGSEPAPSAAAASASAGPTPLRPASPSATTAPAPTAPTSGSEPAPAPLARLVHGGLSETSEAGNRERRQVSRAAQCQEEAVVKFLIKQSRS